MTASVKAQFIESPQALLQLAENVPTVGRASVEEAQNASSRKRPQMTTQAPRLTQGTDFEDALVVYMTSVLNLSVALANDQTKVITAQTNTSQGMIVGAKAASDQAVKDLQKAEAAAAQQQQESKWQKILGWLGAAIMCVIGVITDQPELCIMGALMMVDSQLGLSDKLDAYLSAHCSTLGKIFAKIGIAIAMAVVVSGVCGMFRAAVEKLAATAAADGESFLSRAFQFGFKNGKAIGGYGQFISTSAQMSLVVNPYADMLQPFMQGMIDGLNYVVKFINQLPKIVGQKTLSIGDISLDDAEKKTLAKVLGMITALVLVVYAGKYTGLAGSSGLSDVLVERLGQKGFSFIKFACGMGESGAQVGQGVFGILQGVAGQIQADATQDNAIMQALQVIYTSCIAQISQMTQQIQASGKAVNDTIGDMNSRWDEYVAPYRISAELAG